MACKKPNIILIITDQHRGDALGCAGNETIITPNLDQLSKEGVWFSNAYSSTSSCSPARAALLTGMAPWKHGMLGYAFLAKKYEHEMPRMLHEADYYTFGIGKMHWHPQRNLHGFHGTLLDESGRVESRGFISDYRKWFNKMAPNLDPDATRIGWNENRFKNYALKENLHPTSWTGQMAVQKIIKHDKLNPLFLKVSFARPHSPYDAPKRLVDQYKWEDMPDPCIGDWSEPFKSYKLKKNPAFGDFGVEFAKKARRHYYANITFIDEEVGKIFDALKKRDMYDNSLIIFTSDHGDMLGDHYHWRKTFPYEGSSRIPMILRWPLRMETITKRGSVLNHPVELRDVLPTFLDVAGCKIPEDMDGDSMLKLIREENPDWREYIDLEHATTYHWRNYWMALTNGKIKYIFFRSTGKEQLFDLEKDPREEKDLSEDKTCNETLKFWRTRMINHLRERGENWVKDDKLVKKRRGPLFSPNFPEEV